MRSLTPIIMMMIALIGFFWWLPFVYALIPGILIVFLILLELFLAGVRGRQILTQRASQREADGSWRLQDSPSETNTNVIWLGLVTKSAEWKEGTSSYGGLSDTSSFDTGLEDGSADGGGDI